MSMIHLIRCLSISLTSILITLYFVLVNRELLKSTPREAAYFTLPFETITELDLADRHPKREQRNFQSNLTSFIEVFIKSYVTWHAAIRSVCEVNRTFASQQSLLVYRGYLHGGIGDHVRGMLYSFMAASFSNRLLLIDVNIPFSLGLVWKNHKGLNFTFDGNVFPVSDHHGNNFADVTLDENITNILDFRSPYRVIIQEKMHTFKINPIMDFTPKLPQIQKVRTKAGLEHFRPDSLEIAPFVMKAMFVTSFEFRKRLLRRWPFEFKPYVSIHARLGKGVGEDLDRFNASSVGLTTKDLARCIGRVGGKQAMSNDIHKVFVSTDTRSMNQEILRGVLDVLPNAAVKVASGRAIHTSRLNGLRISRKMKLEAFYRAFVDLGILGGAKSIVYFKSGFVDVAQWLGAITDGHMLSMDFCSTVV